MKKHTQKIELFGASRLHSEGGADREASGVGVLRVVSCAHVECDSLPRHDLHAAGLDATRQLQDSEHRGARLVAQLRGRQRHRSLRRTRQSSGLRAKGRALHGHAIRALLVHRQARVHRQVH